MQKIYRTERVSYVVRLVGDRDIKSQIASPCFMGMKGFALCGILNKGETLVDFNKRMADCETKLELEWGKK